MNAILDMLIIIASLLFIIMVFVFLVLDCLTRIRAELYHQNDLKDKKGNT